MINSIAKELATYLNHSAFIAGVIAGLGLAAAVYFVGKFIETHWKTVLLICAVLIAVSMLLIAI